ncbi:craniofacial development protein 2-like [Condylostylus longicornis]|uniref:craniofacial development protein 2-like n=1 Tax=Condylostylus longicornis TaxID=2530218 RepID=UPI00244DDE10|nr:craniofacial development protein 2-like [Condylostylus longicornis]
METSRLAQLKVEMFRYRVKVMGVCEVRWAGSGEIITKNASQMLYSGNDQGGSNGVAILLDKTIRKSLINWKPVSDRIITAKLHPRLRKMTVVQCYAPTETSDDEAKDEFYYQLSNLVQETSTLPSNVVGPFGYGTLTNNGRRLIEICTEHNLAIGGTLFPHKDIHKYTWESPNGQTRNQIDHICISNKWQSLLDVRNRRGVDIHSDHVLLTGDIRLRPSSIHDRLNKRM